MLARVSCRCALPLRVGGVSMRRTLVSASLKKSAASRGPSSASKASSTSTPTTAPTTPSTGMAPAAPSIANGVLNKYNLFETVRNDQQQQQSIEVGDSTNTTSSTSTPALPAVQRVGRRGFTVSGIKFRGGVLLVNGGVFLWDVREARELTEEHFAMFDVVFPVPELLIIGTGDAMHPLSPALQKRFRQRGIQVETMVSRRAAATYNILVEEERSVACALIPMQPTSAREWNSAETDEEKPSPTVMRSVR